MVLLQSGKISGSIQLFNENKKLSQIIEAHSGIFFSLKILSNNKDLKYSLFSFCSRSSVTELKLHLIQIDADENIPRFPKRVVDLPTSKLPDNDFPISVVFDESVALIFVYTKFGFVYAIEPHTGTCLSYNKYSESPIFLVLPASDHKSTHILCRNGDVIKSVVDIEELFSELIENGPDVYQPVGIVMNNISIPEQEKIYRNQFDKLKNSGNYLSALLLVSRSEKNFMRTFEYISSIKDFPNIGDTSALLEYFALILENGSLNEVESLELIQLAISKNKLEIVRKWLESDKIFCTTQLGKIVLEVEPSLALDIFEKSGSISMILYCLAILGKFDDFSILLENHISDLDAPSVFSTLLKKNKGFLLKFLNSISAARGFIFNERLMRDILLSDLGDMVSDIIQLIFDNPKILVDCKSVDINTDFALKIVDKNPDEFSRYVEMCKNQCLEFRHETILPLLKAANLNSIAFCYESDIDEAFKLAEYLIGHEEEIHSMHLSSSSIKLLINSLLDDNVEKYGALCARLGELVSFEDFEDVKNNLKDMLNDALFCNFLVFWSSKIDFSEDEANNLLISTIKLGDDSKLSELCQKVSFADPLKIFEEIEVKDVE